MYCIYLLLYLVHILCISCICCAYCMYFLQPNLLGVTYGHDTYNTYRYILICTETHTSYIHICIQIHAHTYSLQKWFLTFGSMHMCMYRMYLVCIYVDIFQSICACIVCIVCMRMYAVCMVSTECICVCIVYIVYVSFSIHMYCMYAHVCCMYCMYLPRQARRMPAQHPQKTPRWGGTPRTPLRAPLGRWPTTFSGHRGPTPGPVLAHWRAQHALGDPKCTPCSANRHSTRISRSASTPWAPSEMIWVGVQRRRVQPPLPHKNPSRHWLLLYVCVCMCMYLYVYVCIVCICMYLYVWPVCENVVLKHCFHHVCTAPVAQWDIQSMYIFKRVFESQKDQWCFCWKFNVLLVLNSVYRVPALKEITSFCYHNHQKYIHTHTYKY